jgi:hypothetical protein
MKSFLATLLPATADNVIRGAKPSAYVFMRLGQQGAELDPFARLGWRRINM